MAGAPGAIRTRDLLLRSNPAVTPKRSAQSITLGHEPSACLRARTAVLVADPRLGGRRWRRAEPVVMAAGPLARASLVSDGLTGHGLGFGERRGEGADGSGDAVLGQPAEAEQQPLFRGWGQVHG